MKAEQVLNMASQEPTVLKLFQESIDVGFTVSEICEKIGSQKSKVKHTMNRLFESGKLKRALLQAINGNLYYLPKMEKTVKNLLKGNV